jgi:hypothetical protein
MRKTTQVEQDVAIATMEEGKFVNGHDANEVSQKKDGIYQSDVRAAQVIQVVEVHDAMVVDAVVAPTSTNMHIVDAASLVGVV